MEHLKEWAMKHKALAAGATIALVVLFYLWFKSGTSSTATAPDQSGLNAYYAAQAAGANDTAQAQESDDALQAQTNQTNAELQLGLAQATASATPYTDQLQAIEDELNLQAYQDYLSEQSATGTPSTNTNPNTPGSNVWGVATSGSGQTVYFQDVTGVSGAGSIYNPATGQMSSLSNETPGSWNYLAPNAPTTFINWGGPGSTAAPTPWSSGSQSPTLTFQQFINGGGGVPAGSTS